MSTNQNSSPLLAVITKVWFGLLKMIFPDKPIFKKCEYEIDMKRSAEDGSLDQLLALSDVLRFIKEESELKNDSMCVFYITEFKETLLVT